MPGLITSQVIMVEKPEQVAQVIRDLTPKLGAEMKIYAWDELQPELVSLIDGKTASGKVVKLLQHATWKIEPDRTNSITNTQVCYIGTVVLVLEV